MGFWGGIGDIAQSISKYASGNDIVGAMSVNRNIGDTLKGVSRTLQNKEAIRRFNQAGLKAADDIILGAGDSARTITKGSSIFANNSNELKELMGMANVTKGLEDDVLNGINKGLGDVMSEGDLASYLGRKNGSIGYWNTAKGYLGDEQFGGIRKQVIFGGAAVGAVGLRYLQGGNLTTDPQGQRNIAGIPFI